MKLRKLMRKDAPLMLEWMRDESVVKGNLQDSFLQKTLADCEEFISEAQEQDEYMHLAIVDGSDEYMGTVSLKHIHDRSAEFAIAVRRSAMGKGFSRYGMREILRIGLEELGLKSIYWYVKPENTRALRFYDKNGYRRTTVSDVIRHGGGSLPDKEKYIWYLQTGFLPEE